jgi:chemotaxis protein CheD
MFARSFCRSEGIRVISESVLGNNGRVVMLDNDFKTVAKSIINRTMDERITQADRALARAINKADTVVTDDITLF